MKVLEATRGRDPDWLGGSAVEMLRRLGGPAAVRVRGADSSRLRAVVTLLHGNEPSGVRAMHAWLRRGIVPAVDCLWIVGAVEAAVAPPGFAYRQLPGRRDLNRCFRAPFDGEEGEVAKAILTLLAQSRPEAVLDLHNNTGHNPPYGIATRADAIHCGLAAWFSRRLVESDLELGALVEASERLAPSATIECGQAGDPDADRIALRGVEAFLASGSPTPADPVDVAVFERPIRVTLRAGARLAIADGPRPGADLTLAADVDRYNWREMPAGTIIGWTGDAERLPVEALSSHGVDLARDFFVYAKGALRARRPLFPIMITRDPAIAASDCLLYLVRPKRMGAQEDREARE